MTVDELFKKVLSNNVKDEELRNDLYEYGMMQKTYFHITDHTSKYHYDIQKTRVFLIVLLDNIAADMVKMMDVSFEYGIICEWSLVKSRMVYLKNEEKDRFLSYALGEAAVFDSITGKWILN